MKMYAEWSRRTSSGGQVYFMNLCWLWSAHIEFVFYFPVGSVHSYVCISLYPTIFCIFRVCEFITLTKPCLFKAEYVISYIWKVFFFFGCRPPSFSNLFIKCIKQQTLEFQQLNVLNVFLFNHINNKMWFLVWTKWNISGDNIKVNLSGISWSWVEYL